ncbi:MAG: short-chain dehydrogenase/reductase [Alphaproteobacteria bacterium]
MDLGLRGKCVAVTGASQGIGRAIARHFAAEGCDLFLAARSAELLATLADELRAKHHIKVHAMALDLSNSAAQTEFAQAAGDADILVNNAGAIPGGRIDEIDEARWRAAWDLKVFGYINMTRHFYARMKARRRGVIVNIVGTGGEAPKANYICGAAGNAALMAFTRALGGDSPVDGIRVVGINPGPIETERLVTLMKKSAQEKFGDAGRWRDMVKPLPFGRAGTVDEIAAMATFLASDKSGYTSGTIVTIDGGHVNRGGLM